MTALLMTDEPINGWRLEQVQHIRCLNKPPAWYCSMMRLRDGAVIYYSSPAGLKQAFEGCARLTREADREQFDGK